MNEVTWNPDSESKKKTAKSQSCYEAIFVRERVFSSKVWRNILFQRIREKTMVNITTANTT